MEGFSDGDSIVPKRKDFEEKITLLMKENDLSKISLKDIRRLLEREFGINEFELDDYADIIRNIMMEKLTKVAEELVSLQPSPASTSSSDETLSKVKNSQSKVLVVSSEDEFSSPRETQVSKKESQGTSPRSPPPSEKKKPEALQGQKRKKTNTKTKVKSNDDENQDSDIENSSETKSGTKTKLKRKESSKKSQVEALKNYINKCGVRKSWAKELKGLTTEKKIIERLKSILQELGMEGRPSLEKCKKIKAKRELQAELQDMDTSNIVQGDRSNKIAGKKQEIPRRVAPLKIYETSSDSN